MVREYGLEQPGDLFAAAIQGAKLDASVERHDLKRRASGGDVPTRVPPGILVSRGKIDPTVTVQVALQVLQAPAEIGLRNGAGDLDPVGSRITMFAHGTT